MSQKKLIPVIEAQNQIVSRLCNGNEVERTVYGDTTIRLGYHGWPTVCRGDGDTLYVTASLRIAHIDPYAVVVFYESHDLGKTWSAPRIINCTALDNRDSGCLYLGNGKLIVTTFTHDTKHYIGDDGAKWHGWQKLVTAEQFQAVQDRWNTMSETERLGGSYIMLSDDYGKTWSAPKRMPVKAPHGCSLMQDGKTVMFFGPMVRPELSGFPNLEGGHFHLFTSTDAGHTWEHHAQVKLPTGINAPGQNTLYDEGYCIQLKDGSFIAGIRTQGTIYGTWTVLITRSADGIHWTEPAPIKDANGTYLNGSPPHFLQLKNGVIVLAYTHREMSDCKDGKCGSRCRLSFDNGLTWSEEYLLSVSDQPLNGDLGYPSTAELPDGSLITTYYQAYQDDKCPSVLYTRWKLEEEK